MTRDVVMVGAESGYLAHGPFALRHPEPARLVAAAAPDLQRRERFWRAQHPVDRRHS